MQVLLFLALDCSVGDVIRICPPNGLSQFYSSVPSVCAIKLSLQRLPFGCQTSVHGVEYFYFSIFYGDLSSIFLQLI